MKDNKNRRQKISKQEQKRERGVGWGSIMNEDIETLQPIKKSQRSPGWVKFKLDPDKTGRT